MQADMMHCQTLFCSPGLGVFDWFPLHLCFMGGFWRITVVLTVWNLQWYDSFVNKFTYQEVVFLAGCQEVFNPTGLRCCRRKLRLITTFPSKDAKPTSQHKKNDKIIFKPPGVPWFSQHFNAFYPLWPTKTRWNRDHRSILRQWGGGHVKARIFELLLKHLSNSGIFGNDFVL